MRLSLLALVILSLLTTDAAEVQVGGAIRRMFTAQDIGPNVDLAEVNRTPHIYALGPVAGLTGEVTVSDGQVFVSRALGSGPSVTVEPQVKAVFLVHESVAALRSVDLPKTVRTEQDLAAFLAKQFPKETRSAFLVKGTVRAARYHIQNFKGKPEELTHEAHDRAKVFFEVSDASVELIGFFTNREADGGLFVHKGQTTRIHLISADRKQAGHLESVQLAPGAKLLLPEVRSKN